MNEELQKKLLESLDKVQDYVTATESFVSEQAPLVIEEMLAWGWYSNLFYLCVCVFFFLLLSSGWLLFFDKEFRKVYREGPIVIPIILQLLSIIPICIATEYAVVLLKISLAPRLYIIDQISRLL